MLSDNKFRIWLAAIVAMAAVVHPAAAENPKIGMLVPLSGNYASGGVDNRQGFEAAIATLDGAPPFDLIYSDSKAEPATGVGEFRKLVDVDGVLAIFVMRGSVGMAVNPLSQAAKVPLLGAVGNKRFAADNIFGIQAWSKSDDEAEFLAGRLLKHRLNKLAVLTVQDDWQVAVSGDLRKSLDGSAVSLVFDQDVVPAETDFRTQLSQIKALSPDAIFANLAISQIGPFLLQAKQQKLTAKIYGNYWVSKKDVLDAAGVEAIEGVRFIEMSTEFPVMRKFVADKFNATPSGATVAGYLSALLLSQTFNKHPGIVGRDELYSELLKQTTIDTPDGPVPIKDRCIKFPLLEKVLHGGKVEIESAP